jgi:predicted Zn-dependent protease
MKKISRLIVILFLNILGTSGAWAQRESGGGEVYGDQLNPWFLENTQNVSYCIEVDATNFGSPMMALDSIVESAITEWKSAFADAQANQALDKNIEPYGMIRIATQSFKKEVCSATTMVRIQFGVLTEDQRRQFLPNPNQVIAETIRTAYDKINLRGYGFIYIAPDTGLLRPRGLKMAKHPWSFQNGLVLKRVLLHELGHLFGLSHSGNAYSLMGQDHPEYIVQQSTIENLSKQPAEEIKKSLNRIGMFGFEFPFKQEFCVSDSTIVLVASDQNQFFGFSPNSRCHQFIFSKDGFEVYSSLGAGQPYSLIGHSIVTVSENVYQSVLRVKISKEQQVFKKLPAQVLSSGYVDGPMALSRRTIKSTYQNVGGLSSGETKTIFLPSQQFQMDAILNGKFIEIFE